MFTQPQFSFNEDLVDEQRGATAPECYSQVYKGLVGVVDSAALELEKPKRPLSAYNLFFQDERQKMLAERPVRPEGIPIRRGGGHGKVGFAELARTVAAKWKIIDPKTKARYDFLAKREKIQYKIKVDAWKRQSDSELASIKSTPEMGKKSTKTQQRQPDEREALVVVPRSPSTKSRISNKVGMPKDQELSIHATHSSSPRQPPQLRDCCSSPLFEEQSPDEETVPAISSAETPVKTYSHHHSLLEPYHQLPITMIHRLVSPETDMINNGRRDDSSSRSMPAFQVPPSIATTSHSSLSVSLLWGAEPVAISPFLDEQDVCSPSSFSTHSCLASSSSSSPSGLCTFPSGLAVHDGGLRGRLTMRPRRHLMPSSSTTTVTTTLDDSSSTTLNAHTGGVRDAATAACASVLSVPLDNLKRRLGDETLEFFVDLFKQQVNSSSA
ncbi:hypothetical protein ACA910_012604 [Epithemia clementina (nom. ined.)]